MYPQQITLTEASTYLSCKDKRTVESWCKSKGIPVYSDQKRKYIYRRALVFELEKEEIESFKKQYPTYWREIYRLTKDGKSIEAYELATLGLAAPDTYSNDSYKPQSKEAKAFLEKYSNK